MINPLKAHQKLKFKLNKLDSNHNIDLPPAFLDDLFNYGQDAFVEIMYSGNNAKRYNLGFEVTQQRIDMLSDLVITHPLQPVMTVAEVSNGVYELDLNLLKYKYYHLLRLYVDTDCGIVNCVPKQLDDLNVILNDPFQRPSRAWKRLVAHISRSSSNEGSSIYIHTNNEFTISEVKIDYLKKPDRLFSGGYDTLDFINGDTSSPNRNSDPIKSDLSDNYYDLITEIAAQEFDRIQGDANMLNMRTDKVLTNS